MQPTQRGNKRKCYSGEDSIEATPQIMTQSESFSLNSIIIADNPELAGLICQTVSGLNNPDLLEIVLGYMSFLTLKILYRLPEIPRDMTLNKKSKCLSILTDKQIYRWSLSERTMTRETLPVQQNCHPHSIHSNFDGEIITSSCAVQDQPGKCYFVHTLRKDDDVGFTPLQTKFLCTPQRVLCGAGASAILYNHGTDKRKTLKTYYRSHNVYDQSDTQTEVYTSYPISEIAVSPCRKTYAIAEFSHVSYWPFIKISFLTLGAVGCAINSLTTSRVGDLTRIENIYLVSNETALVKTCEDDKKREISLYVKASPFESRLDHPPPPLSNHVIGQLPDGTDMISICGTIDGRIYALFKGVSCGWLLVQFTSAQSLLSKAADSFMSPMSSNHDA